MISLDTTLHLDFICMFLFLYPNFVYLASTGHEYTVQQNELNCTHKYALCNVVFEYLLLGSSMQCIVFLHMYIHVHSAVIFEHMISHGQLTCK